MVKQNTIDKFYTEREIAKRLNVTVVTLCKLRKNKEIDFFRVGNSVRYPSHVWNGVLKLEPTNDLPEDKS